MAAFSPSYPSKVMSCFGVVGDELLSDNGWGGLVDFFEASPLGSLPSNVWLEFFLSYLCFFRFSYGLLRQRAGITGEELCEMIGGGFVVSQPGWFFPYC